MMESNIVENLTKEMVEKIWESLFFVLMLELFAKLLWSVKQDNPKASVF